MPRLVPILGLALALALALSPGGCATGRASRTRERSARVELLYGRPLTPRSRIREIETFACTLDAASEPDPSVARDDLRLEAARVGGDVVGNVACHEADPRHHPDCWRVARCTGDVFRTR